MAAARPDRLRWMATVPLQEPRRAAAMLREAKSAGCAGVEIGTSTGARRLDDPALRAVLGRGRGPWAPGDVAPGIPAPAPGFDDFHLTNVIGNMLETTIAIERLIMAGVLDRHPGLTIVIVHSGGYFA